MVMLFGVGETDSTQIQKSVTILPVYSKPLPGPDEVDILHVEMGPVSL